VFCIGGGELYRAALPFATTLHMTEIARAFEGDARFPPIDRGDGARPRARIARPPSPADSRIRTSRTSATRKGVSSS
jgi:dihydrofolate reductase